MDENPYDVIVVGGSVAGLQAALVLGRARWRVAVVDAGHPVNETVAHSHGFLTRDGAPPAELLAAGREEVARYGVDLVDDEVVGGARRNGMFGLLRAGGDALVGRRLVLATGMRIPRPDLPGLEEIWGGDAATCPFCHGYEVRDQRVAVVSAAPQGGHLAALLTQWTDDVVAYVPAEVDTADAEALGARVDHRRPVRLEVDAGRLRAVVLDDGEVVPRDALFVGVPPAPASPLAEAFGCALGDDGFPVVDAFGATSVPGLWAVGNAAAWNHQLVGAAASGSVAATAITRDLVWSRLADA